MLPGLIAMVAALLAWLRETRRLDRRSLDEARGWDTSEEEFRRELLGRRRRHRLMVSFFSALAGLAAGWMILLIGWPQ